MKTSKQKGFTLIEIVIVMAIAALMILVVFQGITGAQKSQRDSTRKQEVGRIQSMLESYASNNNGLYPTPANIGNLSGYESNSAAGLISGGAPKYSVVAACPNPVTSGTYNILYTQPNGTRSYTLSVCLEATNGSVQIAP
jgi:prepilin-type N-terminal cleavage/methylation domain-containing protein